MELAARRITSGSTILMGILSFTFRSSAMESSRTQPWCFPDRSLLSSALALLDEKLELAEVVCTLSLRVTLACTALRIRSSTGRVTGHACQTVHIAGHVVRAQRIWELRCAVVPAVRGVIGFR